MADFPVGSDVPVNTTDTEVLSTASTIGLSPLLNKLLALGRALIDKIGTGASTPVANSVFVGNGTGASTWLAGLTSGYIGANAVTQSVRAVGSTSGPTRTVNTYADVAEMSIAITTIGGNVEINFQGSVSNSAANSTTIFGVSQGGAAPPTASEVMFGEPTANLVFPINLTYLVTGLAAGTYTFSIQWKTDSGTVTMNTTRRIMTVKEFKR